MIAMGLALAAGQPASSAQNLEYAVKANFLVRFTAFVAWPAPAFAGPGSPINLCVVGADPFGQTLDQAAAGQTAHGRPINLRRLQRIDQGCHLAYIGRGGAEAARPVQGAPVLIVTDETSGRSRGAIHFVVMDDRVRFHIDQTAAASTGLNLDSRLLSLAVSVRGGRPG